MGQRITGLRLPANIAYTNGATSVMVGQHFTTGFTMGGIVQSLERDDGVVLLTFEDGNQVLLFGSGMLAEVERKIEKPAKTERALKP